MAPTAQGNVIEYGAIFDADTGRLALFKADVVSVNSNGVALLKTTEEDDDQINERFYVYVPGKGVSTIESIASILPTASNLLLEHVIGLNDRNQVVVQYNTRQEVTLPLYDQFGNFLDYTHPEKRRIFLISLDIKQAAPNSPILVSPSYLVSWFVYVRGGVRLTTAAGLDLSSIPHLRLR